MGSIKREVTRRFSGRWHVFKHFSDNTSIHGLKYITQNDATLYERYRIILLKYNLFEPITKKTTRWGWTIVFLAGVAFALYFCMQMWNKYEDSPVLISLDSTRSLHQNSSFPAVTVCNVNKVSRTRLQEILKEKR